jgi:hypothetical protein
MHSERSPACVVPPQDTNWHKSGSGDLVATTVVRAAMTKRA